MTYDAIRKILNALKDGDVSLETAEKKLSSLLFSDIGFAKVDLHRQHRKGFPEVIFGSGKTADQILAIAAKLYESKQAILITRLAQECFDIVHKDLPQLKYHPEARCATWRLSNEQVGRGDIVIAAAGTSDIPVAEEAAVTAEFMGNKTHRLYDVGVAGLHRLVAYRELLLNAEVIIAVAGMEGALPSVIGGLVSCPVIGVPTSVGYGTQFQGLTPLLCMLNSCASGVTVVNIDNGFGAGYAAALMNRVR
ncbi:nickel pincer cofactor biosynthesis protein LarB [bacterium]|nr:nickel pincer cofactor biosynthesis protein LarB [candidate division CSSED10-310 bacterium]